LRTHGLDIDRKHGGSKSHIDAHADAELGVHGGWNYKHQQWNQEQTGKVKQTHTKNLLALSCLIRWGMNLFELNQGKGITQPD
jgi:hypothetical protein